MVSAKNKIHGFLNKSMEIKKFLKPTKVKIIIFMIIAFLSMSLIVLALVIIIDSSSVELFTRNFGKLTVAVLILLQFFYWYLVSCIIVWLFDKIKKINNSQKRNFLK